MGGMRKRKMMFWCSLGALLLVRLLVMIATPVFDPSEARQDAMRSLGDCYLTDYAHTEPFWKLAAAD